MLTEKSNWISVEDRLPQPEVEVLIFTEYGVITTAMYEDGSVDREDSIWNWYDICYDEKDGKYFIPEGWWEYRHFNADEVWNNPVDQKVIYWMSLPTIESRREVLWITK